MSQRARGSLLVRLRVRGFDACRALPFEGGMRVGCSWCQAVAINGVACHETGCPNQKREQAPAEEQP